MFTSPHSDLFVIVKIGTPTKTGEKCLPIDAGHDEPVFAPPRRPLLTNRPRYRLSLSGARVGPDACDSFRQCRWSQEGTTRSGKKCAAIQEIWF